MYDFTPTDGGQVVNLKPGQQILLSTIVNGEEYFVCHYPSYTGGYFGYTNWDGNKGNFLKLVPQDAAATEAASPSIWTIDEPVPFKSGEKTYPIDGIAYTMWSTNPGGDSYTLLTSSGNSFRYQGDLTREADNANICNAIFVVPTSSASTPFDPNNTMGRGTKFNGAKGYGFLGMPYHEVYWLDIPRGNGNPVAYLNASLVGFNKTLETIKYSNNEASARPGQALYAFGNKDKHHATPRTIFRLYILDETTTSSCPDSYFFAFDEQDYKQYNKDFAKTPATYTIKKKTYTIDRLACMERIPDTKYHVSDYMYVPIPDSTYYFVGYQNKYCHTGQGDAFNSQFKNIDTLKIQHLGKPAPRGAFGRMIVDTTQTDKQNLGVEFQPGGYFLRTNTGRNIRLVPNADGTVWTCEEMWHITAEYTALTIKATMFTGSEYDEHDPGADIPDWSVPVVGTSVPVVGGGSIIDCDGWARIHIDNAAPNGAIEFVPANPDRHIHYDNNGCTGDTIADQYPMYGKTKVAARDARLVKGFTFHGWATSPDGDVLYHPGDSIDLVPGTTTLYAKATYNGTIHVALSFKKDDGKRYFLTHPGTAAPRFSRARYIKDWTDAYQGMANADNVDDKYINTFKLKNDFEVEIPEGEFPLDPRRELRYGAKDSLLFYEYFAPAKEEYLGLYYEDPNTVLANNTWAGLFTSTNGWPDYTVADVQNTKLKSTHYVHRVNGVLRRDERSNSSAPFVKYNAAANQFDGDASEANATVFQISRVRVADEHYVVIPDATTEWTDTITFGIHHDENIESPVWSKLIGKQLMAMMKLDDDTVYFHPNPDKIITEYQQLRLNANYRLEESFEYIRDARVESLGEAVLAEDKPTMNERLEKNYFGRLVTSGLNTPIDVIYNGQYIDIIDTIRITLRTLGPVKIKEYYGRWKEGAPGLHIRPDGSRYRDIIVRTKTVHYSETEERLVLSPEVPAYMFSPLKDAEKILNFTLAKERFRQLLDTKGNVLAEEILSSRETTTLLHITTSQCTFTSGSPSSYFDIVNERTLEDHVALITKANNESGPNHDTLLVNTEVTIDAVSHPLSCRVPLVQTTLESEELVWSAVVNGQRYFIMAGEDGGNKSLIFRQYEQKGNTLYKKEDGKTQLVKGSLDAANSDTKYITPWKYAYVNQDLQQLTLAIDAPVDLKFIITGSTPGVLENSDPATAATLTYEYVNVYVNENENFEEQVKLKYGNDKWLKLIVTADVPSLTLADDDDDATVFSWTYLEHEYELLNNGAYPNKPQLEFGYNNTTGASVQTRYKARRVYSMLLNNTITYCGREDENDIADLVNSALDWKTDTTFTLIRDSRFSDGASGLSRTTNSSTLTTTVTPSGDSPTDIQFGGKYVNIVDTLDVQISLKDGAPDYRFADKWSSFKSVEDAHLKIPLIRKTYHSAPYDSLICMVENDEYNYVFPPVVSEETNTHTFVFGTDHRHGTNVLDVDNRVISYDGEADSHTDLMDFTNPALTEIRLIEDNGSTPDWCEISNIGKHSITVRCKGDGIRSPRSANILLAYAMKVNEKWRYINFRVQVAQSSRFQFEGNQHLVHSKGASGDDLKDGVQQVHENRTILYYYNPSNVAQSTDQRVELPIRERNFYGWWRWYSL
ncbi:MAG: InlB B-repeat-containing protein, partial [Paludibacteraceae bacterium]|nr:InlB B-repeat-containing protein [Paludibacteraceae bacterium]